MIKVGDRLIARGTLRVRDREFNLYFPTKDTIFEVIQLTAPNGYVLRDLKTLYTSDWDIDQINFSFEICYECSLEDWIDIL